ncbi:hypothetical protein E4U60_006676 [Claviceps pazoutovae]|uniref:Uncharacterized protein n=1 Tax=Claviceps pazoutovae TaxID=1649127 RepID=A0A9P7SEH2_9HYPO|nr:hypothetical protein E4U60_006676 [Claviceps pazoutovae]
MDNQVVKRITEDDGEVVKRPEQGPHGIATLMSRSASTAVAAKRGESPPPASGFCGAAINSLVTFQH